MTGSAGTAFVDLQPRFGGGWTSAVVKEAETAGAAGSQALGGFATKTGGLFQTLDHQLAGFGVPFTGQLSTIGSHLQTVDSEAEKTGGRLGALKEIGTAAFVGVAAAAVGFGAISVKAFLEGQDASESYDQALKNVGATHEEIAPKLDATIKTLAGYGHAQDEVELSAANLTRATKDAGKALDLMGLAADISAGRHIDLATATNILVKVETGHVALLGRLGINTKDANGKTIDAATAVQRLTQLYGGSAAAASKTYAGELRALGAELHNVEEELGGKIIPFVVELGKGLLDGVHGIEAINSATGGWLGTLAGTVAVGAGVLIAVNKIGDGLRALGGFLGTATGLTKAHAEAEGEDAAATVAATEARGATAEAAAAEVAATEGLAAAQLQLFTATEADVAAEGQLAFLLPEMGAAAGAAAAEVDALAVAEETATTSAGGLGGSFAFLGTEVSTLGGGLAALAGGFLIGKTAGDALNKALAGQRANIPELVTSLGDLANTHHIDGAAAGDYGDHLQKLSGDINNLAKGNNPFTIFTGDRHRAIADVKDLNTALEGLLQTQGPDAATKAFGELANQLKADGVSIDEVGFRFAPFLSQLDNAKVHAQDTAAASNELGQSFDQLAKKQLAAQSAQLSIADAFDNVRTAEEALNQAKADEAGTGQNAINAAQQETSARQSLASAIDSQTQAAISLGDAQEKLAQFNGPVDTQIRSLQRTQIEDRVVTTPEEARQKEIDLLTFDENSANTRESLQKQVASAEHGVEQATNGVANAQDGVAKAAEARRKVQTDAAQAVRDGERKVAEATIAVATQLQNAANKGEINNTQLQAYLTLLDMIAKTTDPNGVLAKNLDGIIQKMLIARLGFTPGYGSTTQPEGPIQVHPVPAGYGSTTQPEGPIAVNQPRPVVTQGPPVTPAPTHIDARQTVIVHGNTDGPTLAELEHQNRKQAIRLRIGAR